jgi:nucleotide-binding universal stress UspA family protein
MLSLIRVGEYEAERLTMLDKVLWAVNFGEYQAAAIPCLARLKDAGCRELVLVHIMNEQRSLREIPAPLKEDVGRCLRKTVRQRMNEWANRCSQEGLAVRSLVASSRIPWVELCDVARKEESTLVVLGPSGGREPGPTTYFAMHAVASSLLILKISDPTARELYRDSCKGLFTRVLLPTDWSECALRAEQHVTELQSVGTVEVVLAHATEPGLTDARRDEYTVHAKRRLAHSRRTLEEAGLEVRTLLLEGDPPHEIVEAAERENVSLILMGSTGKSVTEERLMGSISERVALISTRSVLLVH